QQNDPSYFIFWETVGSGDDFVFVWSHTELAELNSKIQMLDLRDIVAPISAQIHKLRSLNTVLRRNHYAIKGDASWTLLSDETTILLTDWVAILFAFKSFLKRSAALGLLEEHLKKSKFWRDFFTKWTLDDWNSGTSFSRLEENIIMVLDQQYP